MIRNRPLVPAMKAKQNVPSATAANLELAFDVGHSSIGWAILQTRTDQAPILLGCGRPDPLVCRPRFWNQGKASGSKLTALPESLIKEMG